MLGPVKNRAKAKAYYWTHREERAAYARRYRAAHPEVIKAYMDANGARIRAMSKVRSDAKYARVMGDLRALKLLRGCIDCGYDANADALQFDHVRGVKYKAITGLWKSPGVMAAEIAKCDVRCSNCHSIVTRSRERAA